MLHCNDCNWGRLAVASIALVLASPAAAEGQPAWRPVDASTGQLSSVEELTALAADFPHSSAVRLRLVNALMNADAKEAAAMEALQLALSGYAFSEGAVALLVPSLDSDYAIWFQSATKVNRAQAAPSKLLAVIPAEARLVESVARDPRTGDLYATTVVSRALYRKRGEGKWQRIDLEGAGSLSGIAYDEKSRLMWIASGNFEESPGEEVGAAVLGFDPESGRVSRTLATGGTGALGDVAVDREGTVYAADPLAGGVYSAGHDETGLRVLVAPGTFRSPQGMVPVPGKPLLIVSDYRYGLAAVDTRTGAVSAIGSSQPAMLDGIDGLWRDGQSLIAIQNGTSPMRIVRLAMAPDWLTVTKATVLEQANPAWTEPVGGSLASGELVYVATGQWDRFGEGGTVREGKEPGPTEIRVLRLSE